MTRGRLPILSPKDAIDTTTLPISEGLFLYSYLTLDKGRIMLKVLVARQKSLSFHNKITITQQTTPTIAIGQSVATNATPTFGNLTINGSINATGDITAYYTSDKRHKNNIQPIENALLKVSKLNGVTWEWNDDVHEVTKSTPKTGLIAQEVQEVLPEVIKEREDGFLALDYSKMMGLMVEAIKEQQSQIHNLTLEIENLKKVKGL